MPRRELQECAFFDKGQKGASTMVLHLVHIRITWESRKKERKEGRREGGREEGKGRKEGRKTERKRERKKRMPKVLTPEILL